MASPARPLNSGLLVNEVIDNGKVSLQQLLVVVLCLLLNVLDGFDITAMAVVAGDVSRELELTPDRLGWIFSFALAGMMTGAMFLAPASDLFGRRAVIIVSVLLVGTSITLTASASTLTEFFALRFLSGIGAGTMLACAATLAAEYSPEKYRVLSIAAVTSGYPAGALLTSVAAALIMPEHGWRGMFWFGGALTLIMGLAAWLFLPESLKYLFERRPKNALHRVNRILLKLSKSPIEKIPDAPSNEAAVDSGGLSGTVFALLHPQYLKTTLTLWITFFLGFATLYFLMSWIPKLMEDSGHSRETGHTAFFLFNLGGVIGIYLLGFLSTRFKLTNLVFALLLSSAVGMVAFALVPDNLQLSMLIIFLVGILQQGGFTGLYGAAAKSYPTRIRSTGIGWAIGLGRSGAVVGPLVAGYLIAAGLGMAANFIVFAVPMAIGGFIAYRLHIR